MAEPIRSDKVKPEKVQWLWRERVPKGMITVVAGRPDQGKGLFAAHLAAFTSQQGINVLYSAAEDSHGLMTRPRLQAAGAKLARIHLWRFQIPAQQAELERIVRAKKIGLIVIDPLAAHLGSGVSRHSDNIRTVLAPLTELIEQTQTSVVIIEHALKRVPTNGHILNAIGGSGSGLPAACRAAFVFGVDPDDEDRRILATAKFNIGDKPRAIAFELDTTELGEVGEVPSLVFDEELWSYDAMRLFSKPAKGSIGRPPDKRAAAAEWLTNYLMAAGGPVLSSKIIEDAKQYGMAVKTLRRAAEDMHIVKASCDAQGKPTGGAGGGGKYVTWDLPDEVKDLLGIELPKPAKSTTPAPSDGEQPVEITDEMLQEFMQEGEADGPVE